MKLFFRLLYAESKLTGKPIVYLSHPAEFITARIRVSLKELSPAHIRTHGFMARRALYRMDGMTWFNATRELFAYMASYPGVRFMTSNEYVHFLENSMGETGYHESWLTDNS